MNILFVTNEIPYFTGGGMPIRDFNLIKNLSGIHQFTVVCFEDRDLGSMVKKLTALEKIIVKVVLVKGIDEHLNKWTARLQTIEHIFHPKSWHVRVFSSKAMKKQVKSLINARKYDIVHVNHVEMGQLLQLVTHSKRVLGIEVVTPKLERLLNIQTGILTRIANYVEWKKFKHYEKAIYGKMDLYTMASEIEENRVREISPEAKVVVIPNGVDTAFFRSSYDCWHGEQEKRILFIGTMSYEPNEDAVLYFYEKIWPTLKYEIPSLKWWIVGRNPTIAMKAITSVDIEVMGEVESIQPYMESSTIMIVPLRCGGGTRLKILEAMAAGLPVVSTTIGAEGLNINDGENILLADSPEGFTDAITRILSDVTLMQSVRTKARQLVENQYDWSIISKKLDQAYQNLFVQDKGT